MRLKQKPSYTYYIRTACYIRDYLYRANQKGKCEYLSHVDGLGWQREPLPLSYLLGSILTRRMRKLSLEEVKQKFPELKL
jgi:hypothetical protein